MSKSVAQDQIRAFVERIERIEEEVRDLNRDKSEVFGEAKGNGFDVKALKIIIGKRRQDHSERMELEAIVELYEAALGMANTGRYHANEEDERPSRARAHVEIIEQSGADDGDNEPAEHPAADADEQAHSSDAGSSAPINEPALTNTTADGEDGAGASVLATQSLPERNGGDNAAQGAATSLAGAEGDADRQLNTTIIRFAPKDDNRPRSSEGLPRPYGCKSVDACATTWRAEQPCTLCRAEIAIEVGGVSIPHHGEVA